MAVLDTTTISDVNVKQLKQELTHRSLPTHGLKAALAERLQQAIGNTLLASSLPAP